ncbi:MAG: hypothetical protein U1F11_04105 [Steroidobacteraceae bacterium]
MRYDLNDCQLPDLQSFSPPYPPGPPPMFFGMDYGPDGTLYVLRGASIHVVDGHGQTTGRCRSRVSAGRSWTSPGMAAMRSAAASSAAKS